jgi:hypothetical protein
MAVSMVVTVPTRVFTMTRLTQVVVPCVTCVAMGRHAPTLTRIEAQSRGPGRSAGARARPGDFERNTHEFAGFARATLGLASGPLALGKRVRTLGHV